MAPLPFNRFFGGLPGRGGVAGGGTEKLVAPRSRRLSWACVLGCRVYLRDLRAGDNQERDRECATEGYGIGARILRKNGPGPIRRFEILGRERKEGRKEGRGSGLENAFFRPCCDFWQRRSATAVRQEDRGTAAISKRMYPGRHRQGLPRGQILEIDSESPSSSGCMPTCPANSGYSQE